MKLAKLCRLGWFLLLCLPLVFMACDDDDDGGITPDVDVITVEVGASSLEIDTGEVVEVGAVGTAPAGVVLQYAWTATGGSFSDATSDTTNWTAPDAPGLYSLSCVVTDGAENANIANVMVAVATYMPAVTPFYLGAEACAVCHNGGSGGDQYAHWTETGHAEAYETLVERGTQENATCLNCHTVGTYGLATDGTPVTPATVVDNGGYDEARVERLRGVQCENCHGPGSDHPSPSFTSVKRTLDPALCGNCHNGSHHPTFDEWNESSHSGVIEFAALRNSCAKCHNGLFGPEYLDDPVNFVNPENNPTEFLAVTCAVCHDPHGSDNVANLRNAAAIDVVLPNAPQIENAGAGRLCMSCHNGRRAWDDVEDQLNGGSSHFGPHHSCQGDMLAGVNGYEAVAPGFTFASSKHILVQDACLTCHVNGGETPEGITYTGHNFEPRPEACVQCHGEITDYSDIIAKDDFDGDSVVEGVQEEVAGLLTLLEEAIIDIAPDQAAVDALTADFESAIGDTLVTTRLMREAGYNWAFVSFDGSMGVHNATYSIQLLQKSIDHVGPGKLPAAAARLEELD